MPMHRSALPFAMSAAALLLPAARGAMAQVALRPGAVFTTTNAADANELLYFTRTSHGTLEQAGSVATGGTGTGMGLGNQGAIAPSHNGRFLYAVNAGSDEISVFLLTPQEPVLLETVDSGGERPISLSLHGNVLYVLHAGGMEGGVDSINGFMVTAMGLLVPIDGSERPLSAANTGPAQIGFTPDGEHLVVTEKMTNLITTYAVMSDGTAGAPMPQPSSGMTPFGFAFTAGGVLIVSEAFGGAPDASAASSYLVNPDGTLTVLSASVPTTETAACWVAIPAGDRFAYTTNTGSGTVTGFSVGPGMGTLARLDDDGVTGETGMGSMPIDADIVGRRFLYVLNAGTGDIDAFEIARDGRLSLIDSDGGIPISATGLIAD